MKIKKGDKIIVISGKDKGKTGKVLNVFPVASKIIVEGVNIKKKHMRPKKEGQKGQIIQMPSLISVSNVKLVCTKCEKPTRVGYKFLENKNKIRICKKCGREM